MTRPSLRAQTERRGGAGQVRALLAGGAAPAALLLNSCALCSVLFLDPQQLLRLGTEAAKRFILRVVPVHPPDRSVVALAGFSLLAQAPTGHGQEEPVVAGAWPQFQRLFEGRAGGFPIPDAVPGDAQGVPGARILRRKADGLPASGDGFLRTALQQKELAALGVRPCPVGLEADGGILVDGDGLVEFPPREQCLPELVVGTGVTRPEAEYFP